ncbi:hypothetical protein HJG60_009348 [Phyllostomus discolor]|uniref:Uncharacterized protein n=1 Tax=Phyllostomus discolor TaxID=89673 RepID=A0A833YIM6_9CHIR|nr:hypothetical protein HJG60_009348 [Phyllostomus discolor]
MGQLTPLAERWPRGAQCGCECPKHAALTGAWRLPCLRLCSEALPRQASCTCTLLSTRGVSVSLQHDFGQLQMCAVFPSCGKDFSEKEKKSCFLFWESQDREDSNLPVAQGRPQHSAIQLSHTGQPQLPHH